MKIRQLVPSLKWWKSVLFRCDCESTFDNPDSMIARNDEADSFEHVRSQTCNTLDPGALKNARVLLLNACLVNLKNLIISGNALVNDKGAETAHEAKCETYN